MDKVSDIEQFYLTNYDFQMFVNKNAQSYGKNLADELQNPITIEYYKSMQRGGCNEKRDHGGEDHICASSTGSPSSCQA